MKEEITAVDTKVKEEEKAARSLKRIEKRKAREEALREKKEKLLAIKIKLGLVALVACIVALLWACKPYLEQITAGKVQKALEIFVIVAGCSIPVLLFILFIWAFIAIADSDDDDCGSTW